MKYLVEPTSLSDSRDVKPYYPFGCECYFPTDSKAVPPIPPCSCKGGREGCGGGGYSPEFRSLSPIL